MVFFINARKGTWMQKLDARGQPKTIAKQDGIGRQKLPGVFISYITQSKRLLIFGDSQQFLIKLLFFALLFFSTVFLLSCGETFLWTQVDDGKEVDPVADYNLPKFWNFNSEYEEFCNLTVLGMFYCWPLPAPPDPENPTFEELLESLEPMRDACYNGDESQYPWSCIWNNCGGDVEISYGEILYQQSCTPEWQQCVFCRCNVWGYLFPVCDG
jgi:hypothetical protein